MGRKLRNIGILSLLGTMLLLCTAGITGCGLVSVPEMTNTEPAKVEVEEVEPVEPIEVGEVEPEVVEPYDLDFVDVFGEHYTATINPNLPMHCYSPENFTKVDGKYYYEDEKYTSKLGVDVSKFQGRVNFEKVKEAGYEFVILRLGFRGYGTAGNIKLDSMFEQNFKAAIDAGLDVGVYFFAQAINPDEAREEAEYVLTELSRMQEKLGDEYRISLPVVYDPESILDHEARTDNLTCDVLTDNAHTFLETIEANGYEAMLYCNMLWEIFQLETDDIFDGNIRIWYADYEPFPQTPYMFELWQYTNEGQVPGIAGAADIDIWFEEK